MSDSPTLRESQDWLDQATGDLLLLETTDLPAMAKFATELDRQASIWKNSASAGIPSEAADHLIQAASLIKGIILGKEKDARAAMATAGEALDRSRIFIRNAIQPPPPSSARMPEPPPASSPGAGAFSVEWIDAGIVSAYVDQQQTVLPEMEELVLAFEKSRDPGALSALRRIVHTLKGESGAVGAMEIERVCHRLEDLLENPNPAISTDMLLATFDWVARAVVAFGKNQAVLGADAMTARIAAPPEAPASPPLPPVLAPPPPPADSAEPMAIGDHDLVHDFIAEAQEHFEIADENLLILENNPTAAESIAAIFRSFHTIKGVSGFLGLTALSDLAHAAETVLDDVRKERRHFSGSAVELTFGALDLLKLMVGDLREALSSNRPPPVRPELADLLAKLHALLETPALKASPPPRAPFSPLADHVAERADDAEPEPGDVRPDDGGVTIPVGHAVHTSAQTMKVDAARIDQLLDLIGELVIIESIVSGDREIRGLHSLRIEKNLAMLGKITRSLRDMGMSMRLVPVDPVFKKMARLVRDLSRKSGKQVQLSIRGGDTEIDKGMVEKLGDPLVHMIRNSMDHGIETAAERAAAGKPPVGRIELHAHHVGGNIHIDIADDGRGLDRAAIVQRGQERGLIQNADGMSDQDVFSLIFLAGFSTAKQITEISGRGVGMDVVKRNVDSMHGSILIESTPGRGSRFTIVLPLTTAIIDGMLVKLGAETLIIPTLSILESLRPAPGQITQVAGKGEMVAFRDHLLPLFRLSRLLGAPDAVDDPLQAIVVVVEEFGKQWGLMVDDLLGQQQIVIKSLGEGLGREAGVVGASILADGRPGLILDVANVVRIAKGE